MSQLFKNLKSIFVVEGDEKAQEEEASAPSENPEESEPPEQQGPAITLTAGDGKISQKFTDILLQAIEKNNQDGFDYIEFKRSLQNLFKMNLPEQTTYQSAYAAAQTMGASPAGLVASAQQYLSVLEGEEQKFKKALENQRRKQVDSKVAELQQLEDSIKAKEAEIAALSKEIEASRGALDEVRTAIEEASQRVEATGQDFVATYGNLVAMIEKDVENIKKYLN